MDRLWWFTVKRAQFAYPLLSFVTGLEPPSVSAPAPFLSPPARVY